MRENKVVLKFEEFNKTFLYMWFRDNYKFDVRDALDVSRECIRDKQIDFDGDLDKAMRFLDDAPSGSSLRLIADVLFEKCHIPVGNVYA